MIMTEMFTNNPYSQIFSPISSQVDENFVLQTFLSHVNKVPGLGKFLSNENFQLYCSIYYL